MFVLVRRNPFANPDVQLEGPWGLTIEICGVRLIHPIYSMDADIPAVVGIDLLTAAKLVIDVMNRCVYSHHHARLEIEPVLSNCEPVFRVDNATHFQSHPISSSASCPPRQALPLRRRISVVLLPPPGLAPLSFLYIPPTPLSVLLLWRQFPLLLCRPPETLCTRTTCL